MAPAWKPNTPEQALEQFRMASTALGCNETENILSCFQDKDIADFISMELTGTGPWQGVPDKGFTSDPFLPGTVEELLESDEFNSNIEVIIGTNSDEGKSNLAYSINKISQILRALPCQYPKIMLVDKFF